MRYLVGIAILVCGLGQASAQNLFTNGTFDLTVPNNGTGGGWTTSNVESLAWIGNGGNPGARILLNASGQAGTDPTIAQTVAGLAIGQSYTVGGDYLIHAPLGSPTNSFGVLLDGVSILNLGNPGLAWTPFSVDFIATSTSHTLAFAAERNGTDHSYFVDNLRLQLVSVPEPTTLLVVATGAVVSGLGVRRWFRRPPRGRRSRR